MQTRRTPTIHLYCLCWNEAQILPYFLRHYLDLVNHIYVFDNGSEDSSLAMLAGNERVTAAQFDQIGDSFVDQHRIMCDTIWQASRGRADWVIVIDMDEHLYHPNLRAYLNHCMHNGITALPTIGYEMMADSFPTTDAPLWRQVTSGCRFLRDFDKLSIFNPNEIVHTNFSPGRHDAQPEGNVVMPERSEVLLLHYKKLGLDYLKARWAKLQTGLRPGDVANNWGSHYLTLPPEIESDFNWRNALARTVPGLSAKNPDVEKLDLRLELNGARIDAERIEGGTYTYPIPPGANAVWVLSEPLNAKHLLLGAPISRLTVRTEFEEYEIQLDDPVLAGGWWRLTKILESEFRWTDGRGFLYLPRVYEHPSELEIVIADRMVRAWA